MASELARLGALLLAFWLAAPAWAQPSATAAGRQIATQGAGGVAPCVTCHGARGEGVAAFPRLAGTGQAYLRAQLDAFADGSRKSPVMQPIAQQLAGPQRAAVTAYFASLPPPFTASDPEQASPADAGPWLAVRGRWADQVPGCGQCHGPGGNGVGTSFPPLAGLPAEYLLGQLQAWKAGARPPGPLGLMAAIAQKLSDEDMKAISAYYAGLAPGAGTAAAAQPAPGAQSAATGAKEKTR